MKKLSVATVFSGIGAFEFALRRMGIDHEIIFACDNGEVDIEYEKDKEFSHIKSLKSVEEKKEYVDKLYKANTRKSNFVKKSYLSNHHMSSGLFFEDVKLLDGTDFKDKVDIFVGGSPCQSFSSVGFQGGLEDARGTLFYEFARLVKEIQPKVFIFENVRNLKTHDSGKTWKIIKEVFDSLNYTYFEHIINASDYGIPQTRRRIFVIGFKNFVFFNFPDKKVLKYEMADFLIDNCDFGNFTYDNNGEIVIRKKHGEVDTKYILSPLLYDYVMKVGTKSFYQKPVINLKIARTILKTMGNHHRAGIDNYYSRDGKIDLGSVRMLTERECHRLMGFTDDYQIVVSRPQAYKQAGNSIVVDVLISLIIEILKTGIFEEDSNVG